MLSDQLRRPYPPVLAAAEAAGCKVGLVLALLDRNEGGSEAIRRRGYAFEALLTAGEDGRIRPA